MWQKLHDGTVAWVKHPFDPNGSVVNWFLFFGLIMAIAWLWSRVIERI